MEAADISKAVEPRSDQLNFDDLVDCSKDITITRVDVKAGDQPVSIHYEGEDGRPYKPCKSMTRVLVYAWGKDTRQWKGRSIRLYGDPNVKFGGEAVGGIRISHLTDIDGPKSYMLTVSRARRSEYKVQPMQPPQRAPLSDELFRDKLPAIKDLIESGKSTPEQAITNLQRHYGEPSEEQRAEIRAIAGAQE